jgi:hypothetical protein
VPPLCVRSRESPGPTVRAKLFEDLTCYVFDKIPDIAISQRNVLNTVESEEIDVVFWNEHHSRGLKSLEAYLLVECKNWSSAVGSAEVTTREWQISIGVNWPRDDARRLSEKRCPRPCFRRTAGAVCCSRHAGGFRLIAALSHHPPLLCL